MQPGQQPMLRLQDITDKIPIGNRILFAIFFTTWLLDLLTSITTYYLMNSNRIPPL